MNNKQSDNISEEQYLTELGQYRAHGFKDTQILEQMEKDVKEGKVTKGHFLAFKEMFLKKHQLKKAPVKGPEETDPFYSQLTDVVFVNEDGTCDESLRYLELKFDRNYFWGLVDNAKTSNKQQELLFAYVDALNQYPYFYLALSQMLVSQANFDKDDAYLKSLAEELKATWLLDFFFKVEEKAQEKQDLVWALDDLKAFIEKRIKGIKVDETDPLSLVAFFSEFLLWSLKDPRLANAIKAKFLILKDEDAGNVEKNWGEEKINGAGLIKKHKELFGKAEVKAAKDYLVSHTEILDNMPPNGYQCFLYCFLEEM